MEDTDWRPTPCPTCGDMRPAGRNPVCTVCKDHPVAEDDWLGQGRTVPAPDSDPDLEKLRRIAAESHNDAAPARRHAWSRYHHALQAMYERGELVVVGRGPDIKVAPSVLFTDGRHIVTMGRAPDQFARYVLDDRRFPAVKPEAAMIAAQVKALPTETSQDWPHEQKISLDSVLAILKTFGIA